MRKKKHAAVENPNPCRCPVPPHDHRPLHSLAPPTVIKEFGKSIGADSKQVQGLIRLAKKNGEKLGFLA
jgi:hypothetical protein